MSIPARASYVVQLIQQAPRLLRLNGLAIRPIHMQPSKSEEEASRQLNEAQNRINQILGILRTNPLVIVGLVQSQVFTANQAQQVFHRLGRPYLGYICTKSVGAGWNGFSTAQTQLGADGRTLDAVSAMLTAGGNAGTFDFLFF